MKKLNKDGNPRKIRTRKIFEDEPKIKLYNEKLKQFWNYNLNPITGFAIPINIRKESTPSTTYYLDRTKL